jgi:hypothetical protein
MRKFLPVVLFDLDCTLVDYIEGLRESMEKLRGPNEPEFTANIGKDSPLYIRERADLIKSSVEWWANLPVLDIGYQLWVLIRMMGFRCVILTKGPDRYSNAWTGKKLWIDKELVNKEKKDFGVTITEDKDLVYGKVLVDDYPGYITPWLEWRPRGLVIMPANDNNKKFKHPQVIRYDGTNIERVADALKIIKAHGTIAPPKEKKMNGLVKLHGQVCNHCKNNFDKCYCCDNGSEFEPYHDE